MGDDEISNTFRTKLEQKLNEFQSVMTQTLESFSRNSQHYSDKMQSTLNGVNYFSATDLINHHQGARNEAISQVCNSI